MRVVVAAHGSPRLKGDPQDHPTDQKLDDRIGNRRAERNGRERVAVSMRQHVDTNAIHQPQSLRSRTTIRLEPPSSTRKVRRPMEELPAPIPGPPSSTVLDELRSERL